MILAAVIGAFVFGMGPGEKAPAASLRLADAAGDASANASIKVAHDGGDAIDIAKLKVQYRTTGTDDWTIGTFYDNNSTAFDAGVKEVGNVWFIDGATKGTMTAATYDIQIIHVPSAKIISYQTGIIVK